MADDDAQPLSSRPPMPTWVEVRKWTKKRWADGSKVVSKNIVVKWIKAWICDPPRTERDWTKSFKEFCYVALISICFILVLYVIPFTRHYIRHFLVSHKKFPIACYFLGTGIALVNGLMQQLFLDLEIAARRAVVLLAFTVFLVLCAGGISSYLQDQDQKSKDEATTVRVLESLDSTQKNTQQTIVSLKETLSVLTGGDSYPYVMPMFYKDFSEKEPKNAAVFWVYNSGKYPLHAITVKIRENITAGGEYSEPGDLPRYPFGKVILERSSSLPMKLGYGSQKELNFIVDLSALNVGYQEAIHCRNIGDEWLVTWNTPTGSLNECRYKHGVIDIFSCKPKGP